MRLSRLAWGLAGAVVALVAVACDGGAVPVVATSTSGRDQPGSGRDVPPGGRDDVAGDCLECDVSYQCNGPGNPGSISLSSDQGTCLQAVIDLICSGALFGASGCSGGGGGAFTCGDVTCTPSAGFQGSSSGAVPGGGTTGSSGSTGVGSASSSGASAFDGG